MVRRHGQLVGRLMGELVHIYDMEGVEELGCQASRAGTLPGRLAMGVESSILHPSRQKVDELPRFVVASLDEYYCTGVY
jgi:hypothetical protein